MTEIHQNPVFLPLGLGTDTDSFAARFPMMNDAAGQNQRVPSLGNRIRRKPLASQLSKMLPKDLPQAREKSSSLRSLKRKWNSRWYRRVYINSMIDEIFRSPPFFSGHQKLGNQSVGWRSARFRKMWNASGHQHVSAAVTIPQDIF